MHRFCHMTSLPHASRFTPLSLRLLFFFSPPSAQVLVFNTCLSHLYASFFSTLHFSPSSFAPRYSSLTSHRSCSPLLHPQRLILNESIIGVKHGTDGNRSSSSNPYQLCFSLLPLPSPLPILCSTDEDEGCECVGRW